MHILRYQPFKVNKPNILNTIINLNINNLSVQSCFLFEIRSIVLIVK